MQPDTEQLFTTVQALVTSEMGWQLSFPCHEDGGELEPFVWNTKEQGKLTPLNLVRAEGWLQALDQAKVLDQWLAPERTGAINGERWLVPDQDAAGILLDETTQAERTSLYQRLLELLQTQLHDLQASQLSCDADYTLTLLAGEVDNQWLCLAPTVPHATSMDENSPVQMALVSTPQSSSEATTSTASHTASQVQALLDQLGSVRLYGYYGGGYNQTHNYQLILAQGETLDQAIEQTLFKTGLLELGEFEAFKPTTSESDDETAFEHLTEFLETLAEQQMYRFSFWNTEHLYIMGQANADTADTWAGVVLHSRFTYNP